MMMGVRLADIVRARLRSLFRRPTQERELAREMRFHLDQQVAENLAAGMAEPAARAAARKAFGGVAQFQEAVRDTWRTRVVDDALRDIRYAWRGLVRQPALIAVAAASVGLGVCVNVAIFGLADELMVARPSAREPDRLIAIRTARGSHVGYQEWQDLSHGKAVAGIGGYQIEREVNWRGPEGTVSLVPLLVTANYFDLVGVPLASGRGFGAAEADASTDPALAVVSYGFWQRRLGGDSAVVGRTIDLNGRPYTITGVLATGIRSLPGFGISPEIYLPLGRSLVPDLDDPNAAIVQLFGRLVEGQTLASARAALNTVAGRISSRSSDSVYRRIDDVSPVTGLGQLGGVAPVGAFFAVLSVVVGLILMIACGNVTGLLLARNGVRRREFAVRLSLGASRRRLVQQLVTEGLWLAVVGAVAGVLASIPVFHFLNGLTLPLPIPVELRLSLNWRLLGFALSLVGGATLLSSLAPALDAGNTRPGPGLHREASTLGGGRLRVRRILVTAQIAVSLVLLVTALLFVRNLARTQTIDPGFEVERSLVAQIGFAPGRPAPETRADRLDEAIERVRAIPGVRAAAIADGVPLTMRSGSTNFSDLAIEGDPNPIGATWENVDVGPGWFDAMGVPLIRGRDFAPTDRPGSPPVVVVNREFVRRYLRDKEPIGRHLVTPGIQGAEPALIVGVVGNIKHRSLGEAQRAAVFHAFRQRAADRRLLFLMVRTDADPARLRPTVARVVSALDGSTAVEVETTRSALEFALLPSRIGAGLLGSLGGVGLVLALAGLYSVISYTVSRRTVEIGIRIALGSSALRVERLILRDGVRVVGTGIVIGLVVAVLVTRPLAAFLVAGLSTADPATFLWAAGALMFLGLVATWVPAHRAAGIEPLIALRRD